MLSKIPSVLPSVQLLLDDLAVSDALVGRTFHCSTSTVRRWRSTDDAPRAVHLALFWASRFGVSVIHADAHNAAVLHAGLARALGSELAAARFRMHKLAELGDFGSANDPMQGVSAGGRPGSMALPPGQQVVPALRVTIPNAATAKAV